MGIIASCCNNNDSLTITNENNSFLNFNLEIFNSFHLVNELSYKDYKKILKKIVKKNRIEYFRYEKLKEFFTNKNSEYYQFHIKLFPLYNEFIIIEDLFIFMLPFYHDKSKFRCILDFMQVNSIIANLLNFLDLIKRIYENVIFYESRIIYDNLLINKGFGKIKVDDKFIEEYKSKIELFEIKKEFLGLSFIDEIKDYIYKVNCTINSNNDQFAITPSDDFNSMINEEIVYCLDKELENYLSYQSILTNIEKFIRIDNNIINNNN